MEVSMSTTTQHETTLKIGQSLTLSNLRVKVLNIDGTRVLFAIQEAGEEELAQYICACGAVIVGNPSEVEDGLARCDGCGCRFFWTLLG